MNVCRQYHTRASTNARTHIRTCSGATAEIYFGRIGPDIIRHSSQRESSSASYSLALPPPPLPLSSFSPLSPRSMFPIHPLPFSSSTTSSSARPYWPSVVTAQTHDSRTRLYFDWQVVRMRNGSGVSSEITACPIRLFSPFLSSLSSSWSRYDQPTARGHCSMVPETTASG